MKQIISAGRSLLRENADFQRLLTVLRSDR
jgi:hypothetical protein